MSRPPRIALVAGEASGDILGAGLMVALRERFPEAEFVGVGGDEMAAAGFHSLFPMERLSVMGITEVLARLPELLRLRRQLMTFLFDQRPDVYIGIDSPDFNLPIARRLHAAGIRTVHYVSPSVWAWRQGRIHGIKASIDLMLCLLPFESDFYQKHDVPVAFVGHPLADQVPLAPDTQAARADLGLSPEAPVLAMLPGSRGGEVGAMLPVFLQALAQLQARHPGLQTVIPAVNAEREAQIGQLLSQAGVNGVSVVRGQGRRAMEAADAVLLASGTATLEAMLMKKPMVVGYRMGRLSYFIISRLLRAPHVALPNLLAGERLVPELIQRGLTVPGLVQAVDDYLSHPGRADSLAETFTRLHEQLRRDASNRAAEAVARLLREDGSE